jgi:voltage-gated potassium channel
VAEFVDVVMHERSLEFQMQEIEVANDSPLAGCTLREADIRGRSGVLILALRDADGTFTTNPTGDTVIEPLQVIIAVGTEEDFSRLDGLVT